MTYLIYNVYVNNNFKNIELRNDKLEKIVIRETVTAKYNIGEFVNVETISNKQVISSKVVKPVNYFEFFPKGERSITELKKEIEHYVNQISNEKYYTIVSELLENEDFYSYPAAKAIHHAFIGGLAEHTLAMLKHAENMKTMYDFDFELLISGILLHDYGKIYELQTHGVTYSVSGNLLGHLIIGVQEINRVAVQKGIDKSEEVMLLTHLIISHHGKLEYGAAKEPMTVEAYLLSVIDDLDAKMNYLETSLENVEHLESTPPLMGMDRRKFFQNKNR
ncbi:MAG: HD domain-containing protein [Mycoplasmatales bacterium]